MDGSTAEVLPVEQPSLGFLEQYSAIIRPSDAVDLRWYCASGGCGVFSPSPTGALMATLEMYGRTAEPCVKCGGDLVKWNGGTGFVVSAAKKDREPTEHELMVMQLLDLAPEPIPLFGDRVCGNCDGRGWKIRASRSHPKGGETARPKPPAKQAKAGVLIADTNIARLGLMSRRLSAVQAVATIARAALERWYAPDGADGSLWELVPAGKTMMRVNPQKLPPQALFSNIRAEQAERPTLKRAAQIEAAGEQERTLYALSCRAWNSVVTLSDRKMNYRADGS
jgi:hypothetical protein